MLQLQGLVAQVSPELGLGYGLGGGWVVIALFAVPAFGVLAGGILAGALAARIGPARTMLGGVVLGAVATFGMPAGVSAIPTALICPWSESAEPVIPGSRPCRSSTPRTSALAGDAFGPGASPLGGTGTESCAGTRTSVVVRQAVPGAEEDLGRVVGPLDGHGQLAARLDPAGDHPGGGAQFDLGPAVGDQ